VKIKITVKGYEHFNGMFGAVQFENGVSVDHVSQREADQIAAVVTVVTLDGEDDKLIGNRYNASKGLQAEASTPAIASVESPKPAKKVEYTFEQLSEIADKRGIAGLREIGEKYGVRSNSIQGLIKEIQEAQK